MPQILTDECVRFHLAVHGLLEPVNVLDELASFWLNVVPVSLQTDYKPSGLEGNNIVHILSYILVIYSLNYFLGNIKIGTQAEIWARTHENWFWKLHIYFSRSGQKKTAKTILGAQNQLEKSCLKHIFYVIWGRKWHDIRELIVEGPGVTMTTSFICWQHQVSWHVTCCSHTPANHHHARGDFSSPNLP